MVPTRKLGNDDVAAVGFGLMEFSGATYTFVNPNEEEENRLKFLDRLVEIGCTNWDTSSGYGDGDEILSKWFKRDPKNRSKVFLASKFGITPEFGVRGDPEYIRECITATLAALGIETIDLYYAHRVDPKIPIEITMRTLAELANEGKIRYIGLCEPSAATLRRAHAVHPVSAVQLEYSLILRDIEKPNVGLLETARELGITITAISPLGKGLLSGKFKTYADFVETDARKGLPKFSEAALPKIAEFSEKLRSIGARHNVSSVQVAIAWVAAQGEQIIPFSGSQTLAHAEEAFGAINLKLSAAELAEITEWSDALDLPGAQWNDYFMTFIYVDTPPLQ